MSSPTPDRKAIEDLWRQRLNDAKLRLEFAENFTTEVEHDYQSGEIVTRRDFLPCRDGVFSN